MNERFIGPSFIVATVSILAYCVLYVFGGNTQLEGIFLFGAFGGIGVGMVLWAKHLFPEEEVAQERHVIESTPEEQESFAAFVETNAKDISRRRFISRLGLTAVGGIGLTALFPLRSLGTGHTDYLFHTEWESATPEKGIRLVTDDNRPMRATDLEVGNIVTVWPEGKHLEEDSATLLIRVAADEFKPREGRQGWAPNGNVAYSKICTHVGCPVGLYRVETHELLCPCHQSTFNVLDGARPAFGPASRSLPQLPLAVDPQGYLIATGDYKEPIGGGFWGRDRKEVEA